MRALGIFAGGIVLMLFLVYTFEDRGIDPPEEARVTNPGCQEVFTIPDSVDKALLVATYYEQEPRPAYALIAFKDLFRSEAFLIRYFCDRRVLKDRLAALSHNTFRSLTDSSEFVVNEGTVAHIPMGSRSTCFQPAGIHGFREYVRTDK